MVGRMSAKAWEWVQVEPVRGMTVAGVPRQLYCPGAYKLGGLLWRVSGAVLAFPRELAATQQQTGDDHSSLLSGTGGTKWRNSLPTLPLKAEMTTEEIIISQPPTKKTNQNKNKNKKGQIHTHTEKQPIQKTFLSVSCENLF